MDRTWIDRFEAQQTLLTDLGSGLTSEQMAARPGPGAWSMNELCGHLLDNDLIGQDRMKRIIAMENPTLMNYDENALVTKLDYSRVDAQEMAEMFRLNRRCMARLLRAQPDSVFERRGVHSDYGEVVLKGLLRRYVEHADHHAEFGFGKRERLLGGG